MRKEFKSAEIASAIGQSKKSVIARANRESWKFREKPHAGQPVRLYNLDDLPAEVQAAIYLKFHKSESPSDGATPTAGAGGSRETGRGDSPATGSHSSPSSAVFEYCRESLWDAYERKGGEAKKLAGRRLRAIDVALRLIDAGTPACQAWRSAADASEFGYSTLRKIHKHCRKYDRSDWLPALADKRGGNRPPSKMDALAWDFFEADYLRLEQPSIAACYERLKLAAAEHGWQIPSKKVIERRVREISQTRRTLRRKGPNAMFLKYPPMKRSVSDLHALAWINGDGYQHNVFVRWPDGTIARPKTWFWQDVYSRRTIAWRTDMSEHTDVIRQSFGDVIERFGIPGHVTLDNTRAAANKWMSGGLPHRDRFTPKDDDPMGLFAALGVSAHWTGVNHGKGHGQAKPIERQFGVGGVGEHVDKHIALAGAFTGKDTSSKPDNYGEKTIDLADFMAVLAQGVQTMNAIEGRRTEACGGVLSFDQAFQKSYERAEISKATAGQRRLWMLCAEAQKVDRNNCITLDAGGAHGLGKNRYHCDFHGVEKGQKLVARFDPERLHEGVHVYTLDNRYLGWAECVMTAGFGDTEAARRFNKARKQWVRANKAADKAQQHMSAEDAARLLPSAPEPDEAEASVIRPRFGRAVGSDLEEFGGQQADSAEDLDDGYDEKLREALQRQIKNRSTW